MAVGYAGRSLLGLADAMAERLVGEWHRNEAPPDVQLHEHLGMSWEEYQAYVERSGPWSSEGWTVFTVGPLVVDVAKKAAAVDGTGLVLNRMEFDLLAHFAAAPESYFAKGELLIAVWRWPAASAHTVSGRTVESHCSRIRRRLADAGLEGWVTNRHGIGWRLLPATASTAALERAVPPVGS